eukprot:g1964.t1
MSTHVPGFSMHLLSLVVNEKCPIPLRQLSAVYLRRIVQDRWASMPVAEKNAMRRALPSTLLCNVERIRTASSCVVAQVAIRDWPENWIGLVPGLIGMMKSGNAKQIWGALDCFLILSEEMPAEKLIGAADGLFSSTIALLGSTTSSLQVKARCFQIIRNCLSLFATLMHDVDGDENSATARAVRALTPFFGHITSISCSAVSAAPDAIEVCDMQRFALSVMIRLVETYGRYMQTEVPKIFVAVFKYLMLAYPVYSRDVLAGRKSADAAEDAFDDVEELSSFQRAILQALECLCAVLDGPFAPVAGKLLTQIAQLSIGYMHATGSEVAAWTKFPNRFLTDEDDDSCGTFSVRNLGIYVMRSIASRFRRERRGILAVCAASLPHLLDNSSPSDWQLREASLLAMSSCVSDALKSACDARSPEKLDILGFAQRLAALVKGTNVPPLLRGRALDCAFELLEASLKLESRDKAGIFTRLIGSSACLYVEGALDALASKSSPTLRVLACRFLGRLCDLLSTRRVPGYVGEDASSKTSNALHATRALVAALPHSRSEAWARPALQGCCQLLSDLREGELVTFAVLQTIERLFALRPTGVSLIRISASSVVPLLSQVWMKRLNDPIVAPAMLDVWTCLGKPEMSSCHSTLMSTLIPAISHVFSNLNRFDSGIVEGTIDLLRVLLVADSSRRASAKEGESGGGVSDASPVFVSALGPLFQMMRVCDDHSVLQSLCECVRTFIRVAPDIFLRQSNGCQLVVSMIEQLLTTSSMTESALDKVPPLVSATMAFLRRGLRAEDQRKIVGLVSQRLLACKLSFFRESLALVIARLVHSDGPATVAKVLHGMGALERVMRAWIDLQPEICFPYSQNVSILALCKILESHPSIPELRSVRIAKGPSDGGSTATSGSPLSVRIFELVLATWANASRSEIGQKERDLVMAKNTMGALGSVGVGVGTRGVDESDEDCEDDNDDDFEQFMLLSDMLGLDGDGAGMVRFDEDDENDNCEDAIIRRSDPLCKINLSSELEGFLRKLHQTQGPLLRSLASAVSPEARLQLQKALSAVC